MTSSLKEFEFLTVYEFQARSSIRLRLEKFRRKSVNLLQESGKTDKDKSTDVTENDIMKLTTSETRRNIGEFLGRDVSC